jgi:hypothetical protein
MYNTFHANNTRHSRYPEKRKDKQIKSFASQGK